VNDIVTQASGYDEIFMATLHARGRCGGAKRHSWLKSIIVANDVESISGCAALIQRGKTLRRALPALALIPALAACSDLQPQTPSAETVVLSKAQECAVGYDLARSIYQQARADGTVVHVPKVTSPCEGYAVEYLRRAGFGIAEDGTGSEAFAVQTFPVEGLDGFVARAQLPGMSVTRQYRPGDGGVYALSPAIVMKSASQ
jgi:hypothetical protein